MNTETADSLSTLRAKCKCVLIRKPKPEILFSLFFFILAPLYYHPNIGGEGLRIPNNAIIWALACLMISGAVYRSGKHNKKLVYPRQFKLIILFPAIVTLNQLFGGFDSDTSAIFTLLSIWLLVLFVLALFQYELEQDAINHILMIILVSGFVQALTGVFQTHYYNPSFHYIPGLGDVSSPPYGFFQQINNQTTYLVTCLIILFFLIGNGYLLKLGFLTRIFSLLFVFLAAYIVSSSGSRIGTITLVVSLPLILYGQWPTLKKTKKALAFVFFMLILGIGFGHEGLEQVAQKLEVSDQNYSSSYRLGILAVSWDLLKIAPVTGLGLGSFESNWQYQKGLYLQEHPEIELIESYVSHPHNEIVIWAVECGLIGLVGLFCLLIGVLIAFSHMQLRQIATFLALLLPIGLHTQVELPYYTSAIHLFLSSFLVYLVIGKNNLSVMDIPDKVAKTLTSLSLILLIITVKFFGHVVLANREMGFTQTPWNLPVARSSSYYSELATGIETKSKLKIALSEGDGHQILKFIDWGENKLKTEPSLQLFSLLAGAYSAVGNIEGLCKTVREGALIYPHDIRMNTAANQCH